MYKNAVNVDKNSDIDTEDLHPYGLNRYYLEKWVEESFEDHLIVRLPVLYGENIKKKGLYHIEFIN